MDLVSSTGSTSNKLPSRRSMEKSGSQLSVVRLPQDVNVDKNRFVMFGSHSNFIDLYRELWGKARRKYIFILIPSLVFFVCAALGIYLTIYSADLTRRGTITQATSIAIITASSFQTIVKKGFTPVIAIQSVVRQAKNISNINYETFNFISDELIKSSEGIINNLQIAPNYIIKYIYPVLGNEKAIGQDLLAVSQKGIYKNVSFTYPSRRIDSLACIKSRDMYVTGGWYYCVCLVSI